MQNRVVESIGNQSERLAQKSAEVLNAAGYDSFDKLANATEEELREVLANAGSSFKKFNPAPWIEAAKEMTK